LEKVVRKLINNEKIPTDKITVLTPHAKYSLLGDKKFLAGYPLVSNPLRRKDSILHLSIYSFKGLESEIVILADVDPNDSLCTEYAQYPGTSRARHLLYILASEDWKEPMASTKPKKRD
jgi:hypothetical protein